MEDRKFLYLLSAVSPWLFAVLLKNWVRGTQKKKNLGRIRVFRFRG